MDEAVSSSKGMLEMQSSPTIVHAIAGSTLVIALSEIGDNTFFIAVVMAMHHSRLSVLLGAMCANAVMHMLSVGAGSIVTTVVPRWWIQMISALCYTIFAVLTLQEGLRMSDQKAKEEYEEAEAKLRKKSAAGQSRSKRAAVGLLSAAFVQTFVLTLFGEFGDRSQLSTLVLAADKDTVGVILGGILGHLISTGVAVMGGKYLALKMSVRSMTMAGAVIFAVFAVMSALPCLT